LHHTGPERLKERQTLLNTNSHKQTLVLCKEKLPFLSTPFGTLKRAYITISVPENKQRGVRRQGLAVKKGLIYN